MRWADDCATLGLGSRSFGHHSFLGRRLSRHRGARHRYYRHDPGPLRVVGSDFRLRLRLTRLGSDFRLRLTRQLILRRAYLLAARRARWLAEHQLGEQLILADPGV
eukprot:scaffold133333_cov68-Phaeocystis_antarctica.AAC.2